MCHIKCNYYYHYYYYYYYYYYLLSLLLNHKNKFDSPLTGKSNVAEFTLSAQSGARATVRAGC